MTQLTFEQAIKFINDANLGLVANKYSDNIEISCPIGSKSRELFVDSADIRKALIENGIDICLWTDSSNPETRPPVMNFSNSHKYKDINILADAGLHFEGSDSYKTSAIAQYDSLKSVISTLKGMGATLEQDPNSEHNVKIIHGIDKNLLIKDGETSSIPALMAALNHFGVGCYGLGGNACLAGNENKQKTFVDMWNSVEAEKLVLGIHTAGVLNQNAKQMRVSSFP